MALIITWRVTIKAEIRPLLCSAAAACVEALVCAVPDSRGLQWRENIS